MKKTRNKIIRKTIFIFLFSLLLIGNLLVAGGSFAYWVGNVNAPASKESISNNNSGQGKSQTLSLNREDWPPYPVVPEELIPKGTLSYALNLTDAKEELYDDYRVSVPSSNGATANLIMEVKNLSFVPKPHITDPQDYSIYHQYIYAKVQIGTRSATTPMPYNALHTATFTGNNLGYTTYSLTPGASALYVRFTFYIEGGPVFTDPVFYEALENSMLNTQVELRLQDPNTGASSVWKQYNVSNTATTYTKQKTLGLYTQEEGLMEYYAPGIYNQGDVFVVMDPASPYYGEIYLVTVTGPIDVNNPGSLTFIHATKNYEPFHYYGTNDIVYYKGQYYIWDSSNTSHDPNSPVAPPGGAWVVATKYQPNNWFRYYHYRTGDVVTDYNSKNKYVAMRDFNIAPAAGYRIHHAPDTDWRAPNQLPTTVWNASTVYNKDQFVTYQGKTYVAKVDIAAGQPAPSSSSEVWKLVLI